MLDSSTRLGLRAETSEFVLPLAVVEALIAARKQRQARGGPGPLDSTTPDAEFSVGNKN